MIQSHLEKICRIITQNGWQSAYLTHTIDNKIINKTYCGKNLKTISDADENDDAETTVPYPLVNINKAFQVIETVCIFILEQLNSVEFIILLKKN